MKDLAGALSMFKEYEGNIPYMYLDSRGYVTVGVGFLLDSANAATDYAFCLSNAAAVPCPPAAVPSVPQKATADQIKAEWEKIKCQAIPHLASFYEKFATMRMMPSDIDTVLTAKINEFEASARRTFPNWDTFPSSAQLALLDMIYNLGSLRDFPKLVAAAQKKDWVTCAAECYRNGPSEQRNNDTKNRFLAAAKEQT